MFCTIFKLSADCIQVLKAITAFGFTFRRWHKFLWKFFIQICKASKHKFVIIFLTHSINALHAGYVFMLLLSSFLFFLHQNIFHEHFLSDKRLTQLTNLQNPISIHVIMAACVALYTCHILYK